MKKVDTINKPFNPGPPMEDGVVDGEFKEIEDKQDNSNVIKTVTPFVINSREKGNEMVATITFLCINGEDELLTINRNYMLSKEEDELLQSIPFHVGSMFSNAIICEQIILNNLPCYISDFKFEVEDIHNNEVFLDCVETRKNTERRFKFNSEVYAALNFVDDYIFKEDIDNDYDLRLAIAIGSKVNENVEFFLVDNIESIVSMVSTDKAPTGFIEKIKSIFVKREPTTNIGLVFRVARTVDKKYEENDATIIKQEKEVVSILTPFDIGVVFDSDKFKGDTIEQLQEKYYGDSDQYVSTLIVDEARLHGIDKEYMMIRGKTKDGITRIFLLDSTMRENLIHMIKSY